MKVNAAEFNGSVDAIGETGHINPFSHVLENCNRRTDDIKPPPLSTHFPYNSSKTYDGYFVTPKK